MRSRRLWTTQVHNPAQPSPPSAAPQGVTGGVESMDSFLSKFFPSVYESKQAQEGNTNPCEWRLGKLALNQQTLKLLQGRAAAQGCRGRPAADASQCLHMCRNHPHACA